MISNSLSHSVTNSFLSSPTTNARQSQGERSVLSTSSPPNSSSLLISTNSATSFRPVEALSSPQQVTLKQSQRQSSASEQTLADQRETEEEAVRQQQEKQQELQDQRLISELSARDREVRAHEQAHAAVGGQYAGAPSYDFQRGPDGVNYAVGGEVPIDVGRAATPEATIQKAQVVRRAALAPAEPSPQDRNVAAQATRLESQARAELAAERIETEARDEAASASDAQSSTQEPAFSNATTQNDATNTNNRVISSSDSSSNIFSLPNRVTQAIANTQTNPNRLGALLDQVV